MPRLSLYRPQKGADYKFIDRTVYEMFQVGGVDVHLHKYIGPADPSDPNKAMGETTIQDVIFLENRDRKYDADVYTLRGVYNVQDTDFNLSQFGLFLQNDTVFLTVHINNSVDIVGRKIMSGDVVELPNMKDDFALNDFKTALKRYYVVDEITRAAEGYSATWYPHLYRLKLKPIVDSQEFKDILNRPENEENFAGDYDSTRTYYPGEVVRHNGTLYVVKPEVGAEGTTLEPPNASAWALYQDNTLKDILSTYEKEMQLGNAIVAEAEADAGLSGFDTAHFFTLSVNDQGKPALVTADADANVASLLNVNQNSLTPVRDGYQGYLVGDGIPPNLDAGQFGFGIQFPRSPVDGDTFLRTDYLPNRLFRWNGIKWVKQEDNVRMTLSNTDDRQTLKTSFINNDKLSGISKVGSDTIMVDLDKNPDFTTGESTVNFYMSTDSFYILTNIVKQPNMVVEVWLDEEGRATDITLSESNGFLAFTVNHPILASTVIRWTVYDQVVEQRQSLSKALRKLKPTADN
jgi:hypothetical protein